MGAPTDIDALTRDNAQIGIGASRGHEAGMVAVKMIGAGLFLSRIGLSLSLGSG
jgi:hypothetical protein